MTKLPDDVKKLITEGMPAFIATASKDGKPNVSPKGSFQVIDDEHVAFADIASPRTIANLKENPKLSAIVYNPATRKGCRFWGKAEIVSSGDLFDTIAAKYVGRGMKVRNVVKVAVDEATAF